MLYREPAYLICTETGLGIEDILQAYIWRWEIEVDFREEKTLLGCGQAHFFIYFCTTKFEINTMAQEDLFKKLVAHCKEYLFLVMFFNRAKFTTDLAQFTITDKMELN
jgi:hypothetical protein